MSPLPTQSGMYAIGGCALLLLLGILLSSTAMVAVAASGFITVGWSYTRTVPLARRVRHDQFEFAWWLERRSTASGVIVPGLPFDVRCYLRYRGVRPLRVRNFQTVHAQKRARMLEGPRDVIVPARSRTAFRFRMQANAVGRVALHGFSLRIDGPLAMFSAPIYFPNPLRVKVLPRSGWQIGHALSTLAGHRVDRSGQSHLRRRGGGTELHELRDLLPGDPYRAIAWKASGRLNKWVVKEVEQEVQNTQWIILDIGGSMRDGVYGRRKLDLALEVAAALCERATHRGDRIGLITVDSRLVGHVGVKEGSAHRIALYEALIESTEIVDADLTDTSDADVALKVARHLRQQDGVDLLSPDGGRVFDEVALASHARKKCQDASSERVLGNSEMDTTFRSYCQHFGLPLRYRVDAPDGTRARALSDALMRAAGRRRDPSTLYLLTDFGGIDNLAPIVRTIRFLRSRHHQIEVLIPRLQDLELTAGQHSHPALARLHQRIEERRGANASQVLSPLGIRMTPLEIQTNDTRVPLP